MSYEVFYKVRVERDPADPNIVRAKALGCSNNCFPKPKPNEEPDWELFSQDASNPEGLKAIAERVTSLARSADGGGIVERSRRYEGPAYYRLWQKRLRAVQVEIPAPDLAAVRYEGVASPERMTVRVAFREYQLQVVEFAGDVVRDNHSFDVIKQMVLLDRVPDSPAMVFVDFIAESGRYMRTGRFRWSHFRRLMQRNSHVLRRVVPAALVHPSLIRVGAENLEPVALPSGEGTIAARVDFLQRMVGGSFQVVYGNDDREFYVNEDGIGLGLARNELATREARAARAIFPLDWIKGNCLIVAPPQAEQA